MKWILLLLVCVSAQAQTATNVVRLTGKTRLVWDASAGAERYMASMTHGASTWGVSTTNNFMPLLTLNPFATNGIYSFNVVAVDSSGVSSDPSATLTTNIVKPPNIVLNLRIEVAIE